MSNSADEKTEVLVGPITPPAPPRSSAPGNRSTHTQDLSRRLSTAVPAIIALPAFVLPLFWPVVAVAIAWVLGTRHRMAGDGDLGSVPSAAITALGSGLAALFAAFTSKLIDTIVALALVLVGAVALSAGVPALFWLAAEGTSGVAVAARLGLYAHLVPMLSFALCWRIIRGPKVAPYRRFGSASDALSRTGDGTLSALALSAVVVAFFFAVVLPSSMFWPKTNLAGAAGMLPPALNRVILDIQQQAVDGQSEKVIRCLAREDRDVGWLPYAVARLPNGGLSLSVERLDPPPGRSTRRDVAVLALALHNQLPMEVETISIRRRATYDALVIDRSQLSRRTPERSTEGMANAAGVAPSVLSIRRASDVDLALKCGATTP